MSDVRPVVARTPPQEPIPAKNRKCLHGRHFSVFSDARKMCMNGKGTRLARSAEKAKQEYLNGLSRVDAEYRLRVLEKIR